MSNQTKKVVIAGGTGFIGMNLAKFLTQKKFDVVLISRHNSSKKGPWKHVLWDGHDLGEWAKELEGADILVNLAGQSVDCIKTPDNCDTILRSRVDATKVLGKALRIIKSPPTIWIQMSTAHIYGDPADYVCDETASLGYGLATHVGLEWEKAFYQAVLPKMRKVIFRTSFVLGQKDGAMKTLRFLASIGLGGTIGNGKQGMSWIHEEDMNRLFHEAMIDENIHGTYIATAPNPVSNKLFMKTLRQTIGIPFGLPSPAWLVKIGAHFLFNTDPELALYGRYCKSKRLTQNIFKFKYPTLELSFKNLYNK
ncbi:MAG: TIGR01777 family protein [Planctomycetota bacterium]|nr:MAG: TIGR01777 family protein [Planctomycetota bacterium]